ncbi:MAG: PAS-domain containing protein [Sulfitobacter sp.]
MTDLALIFAVVLSTVLLSLWWVFRKDAPFVAASAVEDPPVIMMKDDILHYASDAALNLFPLSIGMHNWQDLHDVLSQNFPQFPVKPSYTDGTQTIVYCNAGPDSPKNAIQIAWFKDGATLTFQGAADVMITACDLAELEILRQANTHLAQPVWKTNPQGKVVWQNSAYTDLVCTIDREDRNAGIPIFDLPPMSGPQQANRIKLNHVSRDSGGAQKPSWFKVTRVPVADGTMHYANSLTDLIKAEDAQRDFVQTLAKTFAHLSIGLAIFNRDRQLALFNPALIDLSGLSVSFLSPRPTLDSFFDAMRENRRMPEPKNYNTWRHRMADLVSAAETGRFEETWTLETGQTYSIKGRPHPDGAIAFLFEDISAEVSLTRNFRAELKLGQSLVDTFEDAVAVFSQSGVMSFSNKAYDQVWGFESNTSFADVTITDAIRLWREKSAPNPMWQDLEEAVMKLGEREAWEMPVCIKGQKPMQCSIVPIASGATVVRFSCQPDVPEPRIADASETRD